MVPGATRNNRNSSELVPIRSGTDLSAPARSPPAGQRQESPSITGTKASARHDVSRTGPDWVGGQRVPDRHLAASIRPVRFDPGKAGGSHLGDRAWAFFERLASSAVTSAASAGSAAPWPGSALRDRLGEQPGRRAASPAASSTLIAPADSPKIVTFARVAAEGLDVVADPLQGGDLIEQAPVAGAPGRAQREPVDPEPVVDGVVLGPRRTWRMRARHTGHRRSSDVRERAAMNQAPAPAAARPGAPAGVHTLRFSQPSPSMLAPGQHDIERLGVGGLGRGRPERRCVPDPFHAARVASAPRTCSLPVGLAAYGIPRNWRRPRLLAATRSYLVSTTGSMSELCHDGPPGHQCLL